MTSIWPIHALGELVDLVGGGTPSKSSKTYWDGDIPWASVRDLKTRFLSSTEFSITQSGLKNSSSNLIPSGKVVIATRVGLGKVVQLNQDTAINQDLRAILPKDSNLLTDDFIYYWYLANSDKVVNAGTGATVLGVKLATIENLPIPLPPLDEQKRIVAKLDETLGGLDHITQNSKTALDQIDALWNSTLNQIFNPECENPEPILTSMWQFERLKNVASFFTDGNWIESKDQSSIGYRLIQTGNIGIGSYRPNDHRARYVSTETFQALKCTEVFPGDILISRLPEPIGRACIVPKLSEPSITGVDCTILRLKDHVNPKFFTYFSQTTNYLQAVIGMAGGTTRQRISRKNLGEISLPIPPFDEQEQIVAKLDQMKVQIDELRKTKLDSIKEANALRSSVLTAAFSGDF